MKLRIFLPAIFLLNGCSVLTKQPPPIPTEYLNPCSAPKVLQDGSHTAVEVWAIETAIALRACKEKDDKLIEAVKRREKPL